MRIQTRILAAMLITAATSLYLGDSMQHRALAQGADKTRADIAELLQRHDNAMNQHDLAGVLALFSSGPKTLLLGTGPGEKFVGTNEIKAAYLEMFKDYDKGTMTHSCYWREGQDGGGVVWGGALCKFGDSKGGKRREYELNVSAVAQNQGGKWQFVMLHYSNLTAGSK